MNNEGWKSLMENQMKIVVFKDGVQPTVTFIPKGYEAMREVVGNTMDVVRLPMGIDIWVDDEGLLITDNPHVLSIIPPNDYNTVICGTCFAAGHDEEGNTVSLTDEQVKWLNDHLLGGITKEYKVIHVIRWSE